MEIKPVLAAPGFIVSNQGSVYGPSGKQLTVYKNGDGYLGASVKSALGNWATVGIHRLVAMAFVLNLKPGVRTQVNHFDMDKSNNYFENLDWVTDKENQIHADLYQGKSNRKRLVLRGISGDSYLVSNLHEASNITKLSIRYVWDIIIGNHECSDWEITYLEYGSKIPDDLKRLTTVGKPQSPKVKVFVKDLTDGKIARYETMLAAARALNVIPTAIRHAIIRDDKIRSLQRKYLVMLSGDSFPDVTLEELVKHIPNNKVPVAAYNVDEKKGFIFPSAAAFIGHSGLTKKVVRRRLSNDNLEVVGGWSFTTIVNGSTDAFSKILSYLGLMPGSVDAQSMDQ